MTELRHLGCDCPLLAEIPQMTKCVADADGEDGLCAGCREMCLPIARGAGYMPEVAAAMRRFDHVLQTTTDEFRDLLRALADE